MTTPHNTATLNGVRIAYRERGSGPAIVFAHGHPFDQSMWDQQVDALSPDYRAVTLDLRGYGASEVPAVDATATLETMADDIRALLDHLGINRAVVAGLSMGGQVAMAFADQFPERLAGLVLAATFPEADTPEAAAARLVMAERFINEGAVLPGGEMLPRLLAPASVKRDPALAVQVFTMIANAPPTGAAAALRGRARRKDYTAALRQLKVPALIVAPQIEGVWLGFGEIGTVFAGGMVLFAQFAELERPNFLARFTGQRGIRAAQIMFGLSVIPIGLAHIVYSGITASMVPSWLPFRLGLAYLTGVAQIACGVALLFGFVPRVAALAEAAMCALFAFLVWGPDTWFAAVPKFAGSPPGFRFPFTAFLITWIVGCAALLVASASARTGSRSA